MDGNQPTPLTPLHERLGAKLGPFAGSLLPIQFEGIIAEHTHVRGDGQSGLFDVSHMGQVILRGAGAVATLERLCIGDIAGLRQNRVRYTLFTNDQGGILDDLMVARRGDELHLVVNAARKDQDIALLRDALAEDASLRVIEDRALIAVQGDGAEAALRHLNPAVGRLDFMEMADIALGGITCLVTRSGYTGEDGFEIACPADEAVALAEAILEDPMVKPCGLGARDSLRLEAGLPLYGSDLDETTTPVQAGLAWAIGKRRREAGDFPGAAPILRELADGAPRKRVGLRPDGKAPARAGATIIDADGDEIGTVTSGTFGPTVGGPVSMGYVAAGRAAHGAEVGLMVRGKAVPAEIVALPFVPHRYRRKS